MTEEDTQMFINALKPQYQHIKGRGVSGGGSLQPTRQQGARSARRPSRLHRRPRNPVGNQEPYPQKVSFRCPLSSGPTPARVEESTLSCKSTKLASFTGNHKQLLLEGKKTWPLLLWHWAGSDPTWKRECDLEQGEKASDSWRYHCV